MCGGLRKRPAQVTVLEDRRLHKGTSRELRVLTLAVRLEDWVVACSLHVGFGAGGPRSRATVSPDDFKRLAWHSAQDDPDYHAWFEAHRSDARELERQAAEVASWGDGPLFSIVTPVYRTPPEFLRPMIDSVLAQTYKRFELILVNVSGDAPQTNAVLAGYDDPRIRVVEAPNRDIATNTNAGLALMRGDFAVFVDHDDFIEPDALYWYAREIREHPDADLLFCAEDLWGSYDGGADRLLGARFKPGWNPDLLFTHDYVCHMLAVSAWALARTERSLPEVAGAQDYDLTFKAAEVARDIRYVPRCLYHWRIHPGSTAVNHDSKPYAQEAGRLAVERHLGRCGIEAHVVDAPLPASYRVVYESPLPAASVLVQTDRDTDAQTLAACLESITRFAGDACAEVLVGLPDDAASDLIRAASDAGSKDSRVRVVPCEEDASPWSSYDRLAREASGKAIVFLDSAARPTGEDWMAELLGPLSRPEVGCVGALVGNAGRAVAHGLVAQPDGGFAAAEKGLAWDVPGYMAYVAHARDVAAVSGTCFAMRHEDYLTLGGLDAGRFGSLACAELCLRLSESGKLVVTEPYGPVRLAGRFAVAEEQATAEERTALLAAHPAIASGDPYIDPNLQATGHFELRQA